MTSLDRLLSEFVPLVAKYRRVAKLYHDRAQIEHYRQMLELEHQVDAALSLILQPPASSQIPESKAESEPPIPLAIFITPTAFIFRDSAHHDAPFRLWNGLTGEGLPCVLGIGFVAAPNGYDPAPLERALLEIPAPEFVSQIPKYDPVKGGI